MASVTTQGVISGNDGDAEWWAFQGSNPFQALTMRCGNVFFGIAMSFSLRFDFANPIPPGSTIVSASMDLVSASTRSSAQSMAISSVSREGETQPDAWAREPSFGPAWRQALWESARVQLLDTGSSQFFESHALASNQSWALRWSGLGIPLPNDRMGEMITVSGAGTPTLGFATYRLQRVNSPVGNVWLELYDTQTLNGITQPNNLLATSDTRTAASISTTETQESFTFSGGDQIAVPDGNYALVVRGDYPASATDYIVVRARSAFLFGSTHRHYGTGHGLDFQNYPARVDVQLLTPANPTSVLWAMPAMTSGLTYTTPDLTTVVQEAIDDAEYPTRKTIGLRCAASGASGLRDFRAWGFDSGVSSAVLDVEYLLPNAPEEQTCFVQAEDRTYRVEAEDRTLEVQAEDRTYRVAEEDRTFVIPPDERTKNPERD